MPALNYYVESRLQWLDHPNVIKMEQTFDKHKSFDENSNGKKLNSSSIVMELAPYGDFNDLIYYSKISKDECLVRTYFHQLVSAIEYLHKNNVAHCDLKLSNLLLGTNFQLKVSDFDHACLEEDGDLHDKGT